MIGAIVLAAVAGLMLGNNVWRIIKRRARNTTYIFTSVLLLVLVRFVSSSTAPVGLALDAVVFAGIAFWLTALLDLEQWLPPALDEQSNSPGEQP